MFSLSFFVVVRVEGYFWQRSLQMSGIFYDVVKSVAQVAPLAGCGLCSITSVVGDLPRSAVALYCASYDKPPASVTPNIDDTLDVVHGRRLLRAIREHWPHTHITIRGDSHYGRPEVMEWCDENGIDFVFGLAGNDVLRRLVEPIADDVRVRRAEAGAAAVRCITETRYGAKSWHLDRRVVARIEATTQGLDIRYVVTSFS